MFQTLAESFYVGSRPITQTFTKDGRYLIASEAYDEKYQVAFATSGKCTKVIWSSWRYQEKKISWSSTGSTTVQPILLQLLSETLSRIVDEKIEAFVL